MDREQDRVTECKEQLLEAIRSSSTCRRFEAIKERLEGNEELRERIDGFREKAYRISNSAEPLDRLGEMQHLFEERRKVRKNLLVAEYLTAEMEMCRLLQQICMDVMSVTDLQIDAFIDQIQT